ncbi:hypothetical protein H4W30_001195 [Amycolatopsis roodepoortensis]|uniref:Uncharacterized protein n=1 Tax=Amycolatopsis roodepoortensis TaxID=700274 RepID=A0ABR9L1B8_9PSEU|nr:hypothetical protein [Amycolatopsis roodepoortensis]
MRNCRYRMVLASGSGSTEAFLSPGWQLPDVSGDTLTHPAFYTLF